MLRNKWLKRSIGKHQYFPNDLEPYYEVVAKLSICIAQQRIPGMALVASECESRRRCSDGRKPDPNHLWQLRKRNSISKLYVACLTLPNARLVQNSRIGCLIPRAALLTLANALDSLYRLTASESAAAFALTVMGSSPIIKNPGKGEFALLGLIGVLLAAGYFYKDEVKEKTIATEPARTTSRLSRTQADGNPASMAEEYVEYNKANWNERAIEVSSMKQARHLAANAIGASTYDALSVLQSGSFDLAFTGIGALCWLPSIRRCAEIVAALLKPGGRLFLREGHPVLWSIGEEDTEDRRCRRWNGIMEWERSFRIFLMWAFKSQVCLVEHKSVPWKRNVTAPRASNANQLRRRVGTGNRQGQHPTQTSMISNTSDDALHLSGRVRGGARVTAAFTSANHFLRAFSLAAVTPQSSHDWLPTLPRCPTTQLPSRCLIAVRRNVNSRIDSHDAMYLCAYFRRTGKNPHDHIIGSRVCSERLSLPHKSNKTISPDFPFRSNAHSEKNARHAFSRAHCYRSNLCISSSSSTIHNSTRVTQRQVNTTSPTQPTGPHDLTHLPPSLNSDSMCSILSGGYPGSLESGECYTVPEAGIGSLTIYAQPFEGGMINIYSGEECEGEAERSLSTYYVGCQRDLGGGRSIKYIKPSELHSIADLYLGSPVSFPCKFEAAMNYRSWRYSDGEQFLAWYPVGRALFLRRTDGSLDGVMEREVMRVLALPISVHFHVSTCQELDSLTDSCRRVRSISARARSMNDSQLRPDLLKHSHMETKAFDRAAAKVVELGGTEALDKTPAGPGGTFMQFQELKG
ncbi:uncharacterized protein MYCFIDRAFT_173203 [Pseudocercospora fijiensis CIRAD86]|uniref:Uncharacterized protein n=1 Tax=Pseudocercospora fijiensis (strain CIRAD86) TaxID=383855 RepID=M3B484_PSEFD|nr:uncharacterized protein MYCFIDRAFT_173203 [Pseudocercospora fijiensis CIRAD86]EME84162.1 hypothetical protein MYCFIDRAFT_173203 [Pseudocercospora fijiensis CIRAD86]